METITSWIEQFFRNLGLIPQAIGGLDRLLILIAIALLAYATDWIGRKILIRLVRRITEKTKVTWDDMLFNDRVMNNLCHILPPVVIYVLLPLAFSNYSETLIFVHKLCMIYILAAFLRFVNIFLGVLFELSRQRKEFRDRPLKGIYQIIQVGLFFIGAICIVSVLLDKNPSHLLAGLGASAAILMLVFKDSIMGLVSGIQLSANDMLRPGDWITMPKYNADGVVIDVTLNTVKVRNFDNTIITIPPYALVSDSFQNWRGMEESGGRRVKRSVNLDMNSVCFCSPDMLVRFRKVAILKDYIDGTEEQIRQYNEVHGIDESVLVNGRHQTNLGIFRAYLELYLKNLTSVNTEMTCMVRQLQPTEKGVPLEIYFFSREKAWILYEKVQADVFDHIFAVIPFFDLRVFQNPSGADIERVFRKK